MSFTHDGSERRTRVYYPQPRPAGALPLVLALGEGLARDGLEALADRDGFCVAFVEPLDEHWNDGRGVQRYDAQREDVDDVGFLAALVERLRAQQVIDPARVYALGVGESALMAHRLAFERADLVVAVAAVGGTLPVRVSERCAPTVPVSVLAIHGTEADYVPWSGGVLHDAEEGQASGEVLSVDDTLVHYVVANRCDGPVQVEQQPEGRRERWGSPDGCEVVLLAAERPLDTSAAALRFFASKARGAQVALAR